MRISTPGHPYKMVDFVAYWRSRGYTRRQGYRLWQWASAGNVLNDGAFRWAKRF